MRFRISKIKNENWRNYEQREITNGRTKPKFAIFWNQIVVFQIEQKIPKISQILQFRNHRISIIDKAKKNNQISEIVEFQKLANF